VYRFKNEGLMLKEIKHEAIPRLGAFRVFVKLGSK